MPDRWRPSAAIRRGVSTEFLRGVSSGVTPRTRPNGNSSKEQGGRNLSVAVRYYTGRTVKLPVHGRRAADAGCAVNGPDIDPRRRTGWDRRLVRSAPVPDCFVVVSCIQSRVGCRFLWTKHSSERVPKLQNDILIAFPRPRIGIAGLVSPMW